MANNDTFATDLDSLEPYIKGKKFTGLVKGKPVRCDAEVLKTFLTLLEEDPDIAKPFFEAYDVADDFYKTMVDFNHHIPKEQRSEVFYTAKIGKLYQDVPAFCVFIVQKAWEKANGIPNLVPKLIPISALNNFFKEGYFSDGVTLQDVIQNVCCEDYNPLSVYHPKNKVGNFTEIYVKSTDMVAAVPNSIANCIDDNSIVSIKLTPNGLETGGVLLRTMANHVGAINSYYDLREVL